MKFRNLTALITLSTIAVTSATPAAIAAKSTKSSVSSSINCLINNSYGLNPKALKSALNAYQWALKHGKVKNQRVITVVDLTKPSNMLRMFVVDLKKLKVLMALYTTNGKGSGAYIAHRFSNSPGSNATSPGAYATGSIYSGHHGRSLELHGLEPGVNDKALSRRVVIHSAYYATPSYIKQKGRAGASWGCFAIDPGKTAALINLIKGGTLLYAYAASHGRFS
jgi:hypothetical protein